MLRVDPLKEVDGMPVIYFECPACGGRGKVTIGTLDEETAGVVETEARAEWQIR